MKFMWQRIADTPPTFRAKVFGGWAFRTFDVDDCNCESTTESMIFIPDPEHKWKV
jgi:hypothetical protein